MRLSAMGTGSRSCWLLLACCGSLLACEGSSSQGSIVDASSGGKGGSVADAGGLGGGAGNGGTVGDGGSPAMGGTAGSVAGVALCIYPDAIPDNWNAADAGDGSSQSCAPGQLGQFMFDGCRYELLDATAFDVDPFLGGHSRCCYLSKLIECT